MSCWKKQNSQGVNYKLTTALSQEDRPKLEIHQSHHRVDEENSGSRNVHSQLIAFLDRYWWNLVHQSTILMNLYNNLNLQYTQAHHKETKFPGVRPSQQSLSQFLPFRTFLPIHLWTAYSGNNLDQIYVIINLAAYYLYYERIKLTLLKPLIHYQWWLVFSVVRPSKPHQFYLFVLGNLRHSIFCLIIMLISEFSMGNRRTHSELLLCVTSMVSLMVRISGMWISP